MCDFFSFVMVNGTPRYLDAAWRRKRCDNRRNISGDSHSTICRELNLRCDKVNKFEYTNGRLFVDQINREDDPIRHAESWIKRFTKTKEWKDICLAVIEESPYDIEYMGTADITKKMQYCTVKYDGTLIKYISKPSERVQLAAVRQTVSAIEYISKPTVRVQLYAINQGGTYTISLINNPCEQAQLKAIRKSLESYSYIGKPTKRVTALYKKLAGC